MPDLVQHRAIGVVAEYRAVVVLGVEPDIATRLLRVGVVSPGGVGSARLGKAQHAAGRGFRNLDEGQSREARHVREGVAHGSHLDGVERLERICLTVRIIAGIVAGRGREAEGNCRGRPVNYIQQRVPVLTSGRMARYGACGLRRRQIAIPAKGLISRARLVDCKVKQISASLTHVPLFRSRLFQRPPTDARGWITPRQAFTCATLG